MAAPGESADGTRPVSAPAIDTHGFLMPSGKHRGERITRVPVSYLKWMIRERHSLADHAQAELDRRGIGAERPEIEISGHAIDSASLRVRKTWHEQRDQDEGLHSWLLRQAAAALQDGERRGDKIAYAGVLFVFEAEGEWPVLKTVMRDKAAERAAA